MYKNKDLYILTPRVRYANGNTPYLKCVKPSNLSVNSSRIN